MDWKKFLDTEKRYYKLFLPIFVEVLSVMLTSTVTMFYSAKIGGEHFVTGVGIATLLNIGVLYAFVLGYGTVFDSYAGAIKATYGDSAVGVLVVKCALQGFIFYLLSLVPYLCSVYLVRLFGEDESVHQVADLYLKLESGRPILLYMRDLLVKYLVIQGLPLVALCVSVLALPVHLILGWFCVVHMRWGLYGLAAAQLGNSALFLFILILICVWKRQELKWDSSCSSLFSGWGEMVKLGSFAGFRVTATYGLVIASHILSQSSGAITAEAVVIIDKVHLPFTASIFAAGYAVAMLTGEALGRADKTSYKYFIKLALVNCFLERVIATTLYLLIIKPFAGIITGDEQVLKEIGRASPAVAVLLAVAALDELLARGILNPLAKLVFVGIASTVSIYSIGIPLMACFIFIFRAKASSIFWCFVVSYGVQNVAYLVRIYFVDIEEEIESCKDRSSNQQQSSPISSDVNNPSVKGPTDYKSVCSVD